MKTGKIFKALIAVMLLFCIFSDESYAAVTVKGYNGETKSLGQIDDIVKFTTGTRTVIKGSFLKFRKDKDGGFKFIPVWSNADVEGKNVELQQASSIETGHAAGKTNTGIHPVLGKKRTKDGKLVVLFPATQSSGKEKLFINSMKLSSNPDNHSVTREDYWYRTIKDVTNLYISDSESGLFPEGEDGREIFVVAYFTANGGKRPGNHQQYEAWLAFVDPEKGEWYHQRLGYMNGTFPSVRVAAGDFNNDGKSDELAVIRDGSGADYYMQVLHVSGSSTTNLNVREIYNTGSLGKRENTEANNSDGCDVVAGDFNNDGKTEIAAVYADCDDDEYYPTVVIFSWNGSTFTKKSNTDGNNKLGSNKFFGSSNVPHFGLIAEAGDLDDSGTDEIVYLTASYGGSEGNIVVSVWNTDGSLNPSLKTRKKTSAKIAGYGGVAGKAMAECSYLPRSLSLALVPMGDKKNGTSYNRIFISKSQGGDSVKDSSDYREGDEVFYITMNSLSDISDVTSWMPGTLGYATMLIPGDFYAESVELGDPVHMVYRNGRSYVAEIQTPPYHIDYVQPDFVVNNQIPSAPSVLNMSYTGSQISYENTNQNTNTKDTAFNMTSTLDLGVEGKANVREGLAGASISGGLKDTLTRVENSSNSNKATLTTSMKVDAKTTDYLMLYESDRHVWRYPVLSYVNKPARDDLNGDVFTTFSICDTPVYKTGTGASTNFDDYNPSHEEGNLFSYPTALGNIPYYESMQLDLTDKNEARNLEMQIGGSNAVMTTTITASNSNTTGSSATSKAKFEFNGSVGVSVGVPEIWGAEATATAGYSRELTNTETFTKTYMNTEKFTLVMNSTPLPFTSSYIMHTLTPKLYADVAGIMKLAFAVNFDSSARVWDSNYGMYAAKPDISLVLPGKFSQVSNTKDYVSAVVWRATDYRPAAIQARSVWFWDKDSEAWTTAALVKGKSYEIQIPVYNASFKAPDRDVKIEMRLRKIHGDDKNLDEDFGVMATKTFSIGGWTRGKENNKAQIKFDWTVPNNIQAGDDYSLYFVIDPDNEIDELHEEWNYENDPGGNNVGYCDVAILDEDIISSASAKGEVYFAAVSNDDFSIRFMPVRDDDSRTELTFDEFREEALKQTENFRTYAKVSYTGNEILTNCWLEAARIDSDGQVNRIAFRTIPAIFPNSSRVKSFVVSPENIKDGTFMIDIYGDGLHLHWPASDVTPPSPDIPDTPDTPRGPGSSSGGCNAGISSLAVTAMLIMIRRKDKYHD